ncbi:MAG: hypothetical protein D6814_11485, partial [Calditrichaeota bacterium]
MKDRIRASDLYWVTKWGLIRLFYFLTPVPFFLLYARLKGYYQSKFSEQRFLIQRCLKAVFEGQKSEKEIRTLMRKHLQFLRTVDLALILPKVRGFSSYKGWQIEGLEHLDAALAQGKGAILLTTHFGYTKLIRPVLQPRGYTVRLVRPRSSSKRLKYQKMMLNQYSAFRRAAYERFQIAKSHDPNDPVADFNVRPLVEVLKRNEVLVILGDALHASNFVYVKILGKEVPFPTGVLSIAYRMGTPVIPTFAIDRPGGLGMKLELNPPLEIPKNGTPAKTAIEGTTENFAKIFASYLERYPYLYIQAWTKENFFDRRLARSRKDV